MDPTLDLSDIRISDPSLNLVFIPAWNVVETYDKNQKPRFLPKLFF